MILPFPVSDDDIVDLILLQSHHTLGSFGLSIFILQEQHPIAIFAVSLKSQYRKRAFISALHEPFQHCSVVFTQSVLES